MQFGRVAHSSLMSGAGPPFPQNNTGAAPPFRLLLAEGAGFFRSVDNIHELLLSQHIASLENKVLDFPFLRREDGLSLT